MAYANGQSMPSPSVSPAVPADVARSIERGASDAALLRLIAHRRVAELEIRAVPPCQPRNDAATRFARTMRKLLVGRGT